MSTAPSYPTFVSDASDLLSADSHHLLSIINNGAGANNSLSSIAGYGSTCGNSGWSGRMPHHHHHHSWMPPPPPAPPFDYYHRPPAMSIIAPGLPIFDDIDQNSWNHHKSSGQQLPTMNAETMVSSGSHNYYDPMTMARVDVDDCWLAENNRRTFHSCPSCNKQYCRKSTLKAHLRQHSGERPFICQMCGKTFSQAANLTAHKRVHTGEKPFSCPICYRPFSQSSSLVTHKRTHTGERPYPCAHCDKAFTDSSTLTKHLRTHTGQKPYGCPICLIRFTQSGNLHRHMKTHRSDEQNLGVA